MPSYGQAPAPEKIASTAGSNSASAQTGVSHPSPSLRSSFYSQQMAKHGVFYWVLHAVVALGVAIAGAAVWDFFVYKFFK